jgi:hypothetical protein
LNKRHSTYTNLLSEAKEHKEEQFMLNQIEFPNYNTKVEEEIIMAIKHLDYGLFIDLGGTKGLNLNF